MRRYKNYYKREDKAALNQTTDLIIGYELLKRAINKKKRDTKKRVWTKEEYAFLKDNWGVLSKKEIAEKLNRSILAVSNKANRIGLKEYFIYSDVISLNSLHNILYGYDLHSSAYKMWKYYKMPISYTVTCKEQEFKTIKITDFFNWFEKHKQVIDLGLTEENCFGVDEPAWLKEKRIADKKALEYGPHNREWTPEEDKMLKDMVNEQKKGYREISIILKRTEGALKRRMVDLKLEKRPPKAENHNKWKHFELVTVHDLWLKGYKSCIIAEYVNRSALAINGLLERYNYFGIPPMRYKGKQA